MKINRILSCYATFFIVTLASKGGNEAAGDRVYIEHGGVRVTADIPVRWANVPVPIRPMPSDLLAELSKGGGRYYLWTKDWQWKRSWFRGPLGHMIFDAHLNTEKPTGGTGQKQKEPANQTNFLVPSELLTYIRNAWSGTTGSEFLRYSLIKRDDVIWVRCYRENEMFNDVPVSENWLLGITDSVFLIFDIGVVRDSGGVDGERWLAEALYWQNHIISSFAVTGLKQVTTGHEVTTTWEFPISLREQQK